MLRSAQTTVRGSSFAKLEMLGGGGRNIVVNTNIELIDKPSDETLEEWTDRCCRDLGVEAGQHCNPGLGSC